MTGVWIGAGQFLIGAALASWATGQIELRDKKRGVDTYDNYLPKFAQVYPYNLLGIAGFLLALASPFTVMFMRF